MTASITVPVVLLLWCVALLRLRNQRRERGRGSPRLTRILFLVAITVTLKIDVVGDAVDAIAQDVGARVLLRDVVAVFMATQAVTEVYEITRRSNGRWAPAEVDQRVKRLSRTLTAGAGVVAVVMLIAWLKVPSGKPGLLDIDASTAEPAALTFWSVYSLAWAALCLSVSWITLRWWSSAQARRAVRKNPVKATTHTCMYLFGLAGIFAALYVLAKLTVIGLLVMGAGGSVLAHLIVPVQAVPQAISLTLIVVASSWTFPLWTFRRLARPWAFAVKDHRDLILDHRVFARPRVRLHRRCLEIHEASARVTRFVPADLSDRIDDVVADVPPEQRSYLRDAVIVGLGLRLEDEGHSPAAAPIALGHCTSGRVGGRTKTETEWAYDLLAAWALRREAVKRVYQRIPIPPQESAP